MRPQCGIPGPERPLPPPLETIHFILKAYLILFLTE